MKNNSPYKSYHICQGCNRGIVRGGIIVNKKVGFGFSHDGEYYHKSCFRKRLKGYNGNLVGNLFRFIKRYKNVEADLSTNFFGVKI